MGGFWESVKYVQMNVLTRLPRYQWPVGRETNKMKTNQEWQDLRYREVQEYHHSFDLSSTKQIIISFTLFYQRDDDENK